jgi:hypothetical protein
MPNGWFYVLPEIDVKKLESLFRHKVLKLLLREKKISREWVEDTHANAESFRYFLLRRNSPDSKGRIHSRPYALVVKVLRGEFLKARGRFLLSSLATA